MRPVVVILALFGALGFALQGARAGEDAGAEDTSRADQLFEEAVELSEAGKHAEAYELFHEVAALQPEWASAHYNAGLAAFLSEQYAKAAEHFQKAKELEPDDWTVRAKLVQTYQAMGELEKRDAERKELLEKFKTTEDEEYKDRNFYIRDQFVVDDFDVFVVEYFVQKPPYRRIYKAIVSVAGDDSDGPIITLETPDSTTQYSREADIITEDERVYSIDGYNFGRAIHVTFALLHKEPTYDEFRAKVIEILKGEADVLSSTTPASGQEGDDQEADKDAPDEELR